MILYYDAIFRISFACIESEFNRIIILVEDRCDIFYPYSERFRHPQSGKHVINTLQENTFVRI